MRKGVNWRLVRCHAVTVSSCQVPFPSSHRVLLSGAIPIQSPCPSVRCHSHPVTVSSCQVPFPSSYLVLLSGAIPIQSLCPPVRCHSYPVTLSSCQVPFPSSHRVLLLFQCVCLEVCLGSPRVHSTMDTTPDLPFLHVYYLFTNERISVYLDQHIRMYLDTKDDFVKHISHLSKGVVIVAST